VNVDRLRIQDRQAEEERICMRRLPKGAPVGGSVCQRGMRGDRQAGEERICMRRLPKGAPVGGRVCQRGVRCKRCKRCKGIAVRGVSQSAEIRGRVRAEIPGRLCSSASRRRGEPGLQSAGRDRRCSKERGWDHGISEQGDARRRERGMHNHAAEERCKMRSLPTSAPVRGTVCRRRVRGKVGAVCLGVDSPHFFVFRRPSRSPLGAPGTGHGAR
jgi:hypothetical protein